MIASWTFETDRLLLRQWREADLEPFAALNADPKVMEFFPAPLDRAASDAMVERCRNLIAERGWGLWAVERKADSNLIGMVGLHVAGPQLPCAGQVEVGWRLASEYWGQGYAPEAAREALRVGFEILGLPEIVAFTAKVNGRSRSVMEKLGMKYRYDFGHPTIPVDSHIYEHCLYQLDLQDF
jgi:RimJ/RimL family protein N-acetyltransferase